MTEVWINEAHRLFWHLQRRHARRMRLGYSDGFGAVATANPWEDRVMWRMLMRHVGMFS